MRASILFTAGFSLALAMSFYTVGAQESSLSADRIATKGPNCGPHCGTERWSVKTLSDSDSEKVDVSNRVVQTVHYMVSLAPPDERPDDNRIVPVETTTFGIQARLLGFKRETDRDFHIVIADPQTKETMIVEIPDPQCGGVCASQGKGLILQARKTFLQQCGTPTTQFKRLTAPLLIRVTGIGFFDFKHGQTGVAKNAIELHPVLRIEFPDATDFCARHLM